MKEIIQIIYLALEIAFIAILCTMAFLNEDPFQKTVLIALALITAKIKQS